VITIHVFEKIPKLYHLTGACCWLRHYAASQKVMGSVPDIMDFPVHSILPSALEPWGALIL
jgi:hypothetical protein